MKESIVLVFGPTSETSFETNTLVAAVPSFIQCDFLSSSINNLH